MKKEKLRTLVKEICSIVNVEFHESLLDMFDDISQNNLASRLEISKRIKESAQ